MRELEKKEIDGVKYACQMMPATVANTTLKRLLELTAAPTLVLASGAWSQDKGKVPTPNHGIAPADLADLTEKAVTLLFDRIPGEELNNLCRDVFNGLTCNEVGKVDENIDDHFRGRLLHMYKVFVWCIEVNYRDFFDAGRSLGILSWIVAMAKKAALSRQTSTPQSGELPSEETAA